MHNVIAVAACRADDEYAKERIPSDLRWRIWERDNFTCHYCGARRDLSIDHVHPESDGGTLDPNNLVTCCRSCNSKKGTRSYRDVTGTDSNIVFVEIVDRDGRTIEVHPATCTEAEAQIVLDDYACVLETALLRATKLRDYWNGSPFRYQLRFSWG